MSQALLLLTAFFAAVPVYVFAVYPLLLWLLARTVGKGVPQKAAFTPTVTMIVSCYNEAEVLAEKIRNCLDIDYPEDLLTFVFVSDASSDGTDEIILASDNSRVRLVRQEERLGKTMGLNLAMTTIASDVVVFSDANAMYRKDAIKQLVQPFADPAFGYVVGAAIYDESGQGASGRSETLYWKYEIWMKQQESRLHSVVGGDGAIYAIRRELFWPFDREDINDLVNPLQIVAAGYRGAFERNAVCIEHPAADFAKEGRRKRRIVNRSFSAVLKHRHILNPFRNPRFAFSLWSHKVLRWLLAPFIALAMAGALTLGLIGAGIYQVLLVGVLALLWFALAGYLLKERTSQPMLTAVPYYFFMVAISASLGLLDSLRGRVKVTWEPPRAKGELARAAKTTRAVAVLALLAVTAALVWSMYRMRWLLQ